MSENGTPKIYGAIVQVMKSVGAIGKDKRNPQQGYQFRGIDDVYNAMQHPLAEAGVFIVPQVTDRQVTERASKSGGLLIYTTLTVKHTFYADDGSSVEAVTVGEAMDSGDKSSNKAMSAAMKYALLEVFCVPTIEPKDSENDSPEPLPKAPQPKLAVSLDGLKSAAGQAWLKNPVFKTAKDAIDVLSHTKTVTEDAENYLIEWYELAVQAVPE